MANELSSALKAAAEKIVKYIEDCAVMTVETRYVEINGSAVNFEGAQPVACTIIRLDGDSSAVLPMRRNDVGALVVDTDLFEMHERNVAVAIDYRTRMMDALLQTFKTSL